VAAAAVVAAALVCLAAVVLTLLLAADDFAVTLGDRLRAGSDVLVPGLPLLLAVALVVSPEDGGPAGRLVDTGVAATGAVGSALLLLGLLADLLADDGVFPGLAERLSASLVDLAALVLVAALTWWAWQRRSSGGSHPHPASGP
jgi:hypothetical protein